MRVGVYGQLKRYRVEEPAKILEDLALEIKTKTNGDGHVLDAEKMQELVFNSLAQKFGIDKMEIYLKD